MEKKPHTKSSTTAAQPGRVTGVIIVALLMAGIALLFSGCGGREKLIAPPTGFRPGSDGKSIVFGKVVHGVTGRFKKTLVLLKKRTPSDPEGTVAVLTLKETGKGPGEDWFCRTITPGRYVLYEHQVIDTAWSKLTHTLLVKAQNEAELIYITNNEPFKSNRRKFPKYTFVVPPNTATHVGEWDFTTPLAVIREGNEPPEAVFSRVCPGISGPVTSAIPR